MLGLVEEWMDDAECNYAGDPEIFFPEQQRSRERTRKAKAYCWRCPVSEQCLEYALRENIQYGIFAGLLPDQRNAIKKAREQNELSNCA